MPNITVADVPICDLLINLGRKVVFAYPNEKIWNPNGISLARGLVSIPGLSEKVDTALQITNLKKYVVPVSPSAPARCIDGRMTLGWANFSDEKKCLLGPKIAGGTAHAALAHRIVDSESLRQDLLFEQDIKYVIDRYKKIGIGFGGHVDDHANGWNTGCGAVDNINKILEKLQLPEPQETLRGLAKVILGNGFDARQMANEVIGRMLFLDALKPLYMPKENNDPHGEFLYKKTVVKLIREEAGEKDEPVPQLIGPHNEVAVFLNFVPKTTFDTDRFSFDNNSEVQVYGWDIWEMYEEARRLYPYHMREVQNIQRQAVENRMKYITTRTFLGIATIMVLTDGSIKAILHK